MNALVYHHCSPSDFDEWERLGATGWNYKDIAPYFRKAEKYTPHVKYPDINAEDRGDSGPWHTTHRFCHTELMVDSFISASEEIGIPHSPDINTKKGTLGATKFSTSVDPSGLRSSSATAYLSPSVIARHNLTVAVETQTTRIIFSAGEAIPCAIGVEVAKSNILDRYRVSAKKEIILCAGSIGTPQILMLSGIGAQEELEEFKIPVIKELPAVGKNLSDHLGGGPIVFRAKTGTAFDVMMGSPIKIIMSLTQWYLFGTGPFASNVGEAACFARSADTKLPFSSKASVGLKPLDVTSAPNAPDIEIAMLCCAFLEQGNKSGPAGMDCSTLYPIILRPLSKGRLSLKSTSPFDKPVIDPNYLAHPNDMKVLIRSVRLALRIARAKAFESLFEIKNHYEDKDNIFWLGDADPDLITDEEISDYIRTNAETCHHPTSTCKIGQDDRSSVVGPNLKVHGIAGLRVADASIFPEQISGHPTATVIAIGEKASEIIMKAV